jgi:hypothetical protein
VYLLVDSFDVASLAALRYARSLRPTTLRAVHFVIDTAQADQLRQEWMRAEPGVPIDFIDAPDRRLTKAAAELVKREAEVPGTQVTVVLPRRSYSPLLGRLLHDRTADKIAAVVSQIPRSAATIIPFDVRHRIEVLHERQVAREQAPAGQAADAAPSTAAAADRDIGPAGISGTGGPAGATGETAGAAGAAAPGASAGPDGASATDGAEGLPPVLAEPPPSPLRNLVRGRRDRPADAPAGDQPTGDGAGKGRAGKDRAGKDRAGYDRPEPPPGVNPIGSLTTPGRATAEGRVRAVEIRPVERSSVLAIEISDATGDLTALFYGRSHIPGIICGARVRFRGRVGMRDGAPVMVNPAYELLAPGDTSPPAGEDS